jgi:hypothetical protein
LRSAGGWWGVPEAVLERIRSLCAPPAWRSPTGVLNATSGGVLNVPVATAAGKSWAATSSGLRAVNQYQVRGSEPAPIIACSSVAMLSSWPSESWKGPNSIQASIASASSSLRRGSGWRRKPSAPPRSTERL